MVFQDNDKQRATQRSADAPGGVGLAGGIREFGCDDGGVGDGDRRRPRQSQSDSPNEQQDLDSYEVGMSVEQCHWHRGVDGDGQADERVHSVSAL